MPFCFTVMVHSLWTFYVNQGNLESDSKTKTTIHGEIWLEVWHCKKELDAKPFTSLFESMQGNEMFTFQFIRPITLESS